MSEKNNRKKILIAEDELPLLRAISNKLKKEGFDVVEAVNGEECLKLGEKELPDLILLDVVMPKMDGFTALKKMRTLKWGKDVPVIILTNLGEAEDVSRAVGDEVYDYLIKTNWSLQDIVKKVREKLKIA